MDISSGMGTRGSLQIDSSQLPPSLVLETLETTKKLIVSDRIVLSPQAVAILKTYLGLP